MGVCRSWDCLLPVLSQLQSCQPICFPAMKCVSTTVHLHVWMVQGGNPSIGYYHKKADCCPQLMRDVGRSGCTARDFSCRIQDPTDSRPWKGNTGIFLGFIVGLFIGWLICLCFFNLISFYVHGCLNLSLCVFHVCLRTIFM